MDIKIKKGLQIPLAREPKGLPQKIAHPKKLSLNLAPFATLRFKLLVKVGDRVKIGTPLVENKAIPGQFFVSPGDGVVVDIARGEKRRLLNIVIEVSEKEEYEEHGRLDLQKASKEEILAHLLKGGIFPHIRMRPFDLVADPRLLPRSIFVRALESLPYVPPAEMQVEGHESYFQLGLEALSHLTTGKVHLVHDFSSTAKAFTEAYGVEKHRAQGPHPIATPSLHIHLIDPIKSGRDVVWTLSALDVVAVGKMIGAGHYHIERVIGIGGDGLAPNQEGYIKGRLGLPVSTLIENRMSTLPSRLISGDPLTGHEASKDGFLGFYDTTFSLIPENTKREEFHFLGLGKDKYSAHRAYLSGHLKNRKFFFTTNQHGEERAFIDGSIYDKVMPMQILTMPLVKAILAEDFELAESLGLLEVTASDFALATFICPSKIEMVEIVQEGLARYSKEMGF